MSGPFGPAVGDPVRVCLLNRYRPRRQEQVWQRAETFAQHHRDRKTTSPLGISEMFATRLQSKLPFGKDPAESSLETHTRASGVVIIWWSPPLSAKPAFIQRLDKLKFGSEKQSKAVWVWGKSSKHHFTYKDAAHEDNSISTLTSVSLLICQIFKISAAKPLTRPPQSTSNNILYSRNIQ